MRPSSKVRVLEADREEDPGRARQRIGPAMRVLVAGLVERRERERAGRRDPGRAAAPRSGVAATTIEPSGAHVAPRGLPPTSASFEHGPAADRHLGELAVREERHPLPVGREERLPGAVGASQRGAAPDRAARADRVAASRLRSPRRPAATRRVRARTAPRISVANVSGAGSSRLSRADGPDARSRGRSRIPRGQRGHA